MKFWHLIPVALVLTLVALRFTPGTIPRAVETSPAPAVTKAPHRDRPGPASLSPQHDAIRPSNPSLDMTGDMAANQGGKAIPNETIAAVPNAKPSSSPFRKNPELPRHSGDPFPSVRHAAALLPAADQADTLLPAAGQASALLQAQAAGLAGAALAPTRPAVVTATSSAPTGSESTAALGKNTTVSVEAPVTPPAAWADLGSASTLTPEQDREVQQMAENWAAELSGSGLDPASQEYRQLWTDTVRQSDLIFMQQFGGEAWHAHHVEAYHLAHAAEEQQ